MSGLAPTTIATTEQTNTDESDVDECCDLIDLHFDDDNEVQNNEPTDDVYPFFFQGSLEDACQTAFGTCGTQGHPALVLYIYDENSPFKEEFFKMMRTSKEIVFYLNVNYVIWPYDITSESSRPILAKIWQDMFPGQFFDEFSLEQCPILIGIMPLFGQQTDTGILTEYQFQTILRGDMLTRDTTETNVKAFISVLKTFKAASDQNVKNLSFNFVKKTGLSWEIVFEIAEYLSLNDSIAAFSVDIIPMLNRCQPKLQLCRLDNVFQRIVPRIQLECIVSLRLRVNSSWSTAELTLFSLLTHVKSVTFDNSLNIALMTECTRHFSNLIRLSFIYTSGIDCSQLIDLLNHFQERIIYLQIRCSSIFCKDSSERRLFGINSKRSTIEYFSLNITDDILESTKSCYSYNNNSYELSVLLENMSNIRQFHLIGSKFNLEYFLHDYFWESMIGRCPRLKKIKMEGFKYSSEEKDSLLKKLAEIQTQLRRQRPEIQFQIKFF